MESPAVAVTLGLGNPMCDNSVTSNHVEMTRLKLVTDAASLLSDPAALLHSNTGCNWDLGHEGQRIDDVNESACSTSVETEGICKCPNTAQEIQEGDVLEAGLVPESEEDEIMLIGGSSNGIDSKELLPLQVASETTSLPIAVEFEGIHEGKIVAKVISLEERSFDRMLADDIVTISRDPIEPSVSGPTIKTSVVAIPLPVEKETVKGAIKSVYELEYVPLWGSMTSCGLRPEMEDAVITAPHFMKIPIEMVIGDHKVDTISQPFSKLTSHFFGVYDGHGGSQVANYCRERIHVALAEAIGINGDDLLDQSMGDTRLLQWEKVFTSCFLKVDDEVGGKVRRPVNNDDNTENAASCCYTFEPVASETVGSTAVVAAICSSHIVVANCGDSRAVLYRGKEAMALSVDHKPNRDDEYARIEASGGKVIQWNGHRVFGVLAMSRSIGDRYLKPWIIPNPEVMFVPRAKEDECLILASDGLWDVMTNEEACEVARRRILVWHKKNGNLVPPLAERGHVADPAAQEAAEYLTNLALNKGSKDNISVIVIDLKARRKFKSKS